MIDGIIFDPLLPWIAIGVLAAIAFAGLVVAVFRGLAGWALRGLAALVLIAALTQPSLQDEDRAPLSDIVILLDDRSASQRLAEREGTTASALDAIEAELADRPNTEVRRVAVGDGQEDQGTLLMTALNTALAEEPRAGSRGSSPRRTDVCTISIVRPTCPHRCIFC